MTRLYYEHAPITQQEADDGTRKYLAGLGWEILSPDGMLIARRKTTSGHVEWFKSAPGLKSMNLVIIEEIPPPHSVTLVAPAATPETFGDTDDFPYLTKFPGTKLTKTETVTQMAEFKNIDTKEVASAGPLVLKKRYDLDPEVSQFEFVAVYKTALEKAGWVIWGSLVGADGSVTARYNKNGRDIFVVAHMNPKSYAFDVYDVGAQSEAKKLSDALDKEGHIAIYGIYFDVDKATLKGESEVALQHILDLLKKNPKLKLQVQGHTDDTGDAAHNEKLSDDRAQSVKKWLVEHGIDAARLTTKGFGATKPVADNKTVEGRAKNRRVELAKI
jgi:outer membrane protein OmpA-like peptidoglycan-associated protein